MLDALFTSTSAVCVTGLIVVDTAKDFSLFGQIVVMLLIQAGGLGYMTISTLIAVALGKRVTLQERLTLQEALNIHTREGLLRFARHGVQVHARARTRRRRDSGRAVGAAHSASLAPRTSACFTPSRRSTTPASRSSPTT